MSTALGELARQFIQTDSQLVKFSAEIPGTGWIPALSQVFGDPWHFHFGNEKYPQEIARWRWNIADSNQLRHLSVVRPNKPDNPFFRVDLNVSAGNHPQRFITLLLHKSPLT